MALPVTQRTMSDEFDGQDATGKAGIGATLNRCRASRLKLRTNSVTRGPSTSLDKLSLADLHASLERAAWVLEQKTAKG